MSGSRPNRGGGAFEDPMPGADAWSSSFTGSAPQPHHPGAPGAPAPRRPRQPDSSYAPYAETPGSFADPYGERLSNGDIPDDPYTAPYNPGPDQYAPAPYRDAPYSTGPHRPPAAPPGGYVQSHDYAIPEDYRRPGQADPRRDDYGPPRQGDPNADHDFDQSRHDAYPPAYPPQRRTDAQPPYPASAPAPAPIAPTGRGRRGAPAAQQPAALQSTGLLDRSLAPDTDYAAGPASATRGATAPGEPTTRLPHQGRRRGATAEPEPGFAADLDFPRSPDADYDPGSSYSPAPTPSSASRPPRLRVRTKPATRIVQGLVVASLVAAVTAVVAFEKTVNLSVDGTVHQIHTFSSTVGAVLAGDGITTGSHDLVSPALNSSISDGTTVTVRYGRQVDVTVNGTEHDVWVHYPTVSGALQELGVRVPGALISVPADAAIGRNGMAFSVYTMRHVTFLVDGKTEPVNTTAATVKQAIQQAGITLQGQDSASVPLTAVPTDNETVTILRITGTTEVKVESIAYSVTKENDASTYVGSSTVVTAGVDGTAKVTYALQTINGVVEPPKEISRVVTKQPVAEVEKVGTKALPSNVADLNWAALAKCESGGRPTAVSSNGLYYGLYQFSVGTWDSLGGTGLPSQASPAEQTDLAELLYERSGSGQWPVCGPNLFS